MFLHLVPYIRLTEQASWEHLSQPKPRSIDHLESIAQLYLRMYKKNEAIHAYKRELQLLKEEWHQDDSADVQRVKALLTKCN